MNWSYRLGFVQSNLEAMNGGLLSPMTERTTCNSSTMQYNKVMIKDEVAVSTVNTLTLTHLPVAT